MASINLNRPQEEMPMHAQHRDLPDVAADDASTQGEKTKHFATVPTMYLQCISMQTYAGNITRICLYSVTTISIIAENIFHNLVILPACMYIQVQNENEYKPEKLGQPLQVLIG